MINHRFPVPLVPVTGKVLNGSNGPVLFGDLQDLAGSVSIGLYDAATDALATASGNGKVFYLGFSSEHTQDSLDKWMFGMQLPKGGESWKFKGTDVIKFEYSEPQRVKAEKWVLGYDGTTGCNDTVPNFECGKVYGVRIVASGSPVFRRWAKTLEHEIFTDPICCGVDNCISGCVDDRIDGEVVVKTIAERINNHNELAQIGIKARYLTNDYVAPSMTVNKYTLTAKDDGSNKALGLVQLQVGTLGVVTRVSYDSDTVTSVYEYFGTAAASNFQPTSSFSIADECGVCSAGYTTTPANLEYRVVRPLAGSEDLSGTVARQTYADLVGTAYETATAKTFDGATDVEVVAASDAITSVAHGFKTGAKVTYTDGGGTPVVGLTTATDYFVIRATADTVKLASTYALAVAGTALPIADGVGAAHKLTPVVTAVFQSQSEGNAIVDLTTPNGVELTAVLSDTVTLIGQNSVFCTASAPASVAWVATAGVGYRDTRDLCISLNREVCTDGNRLAELQAYYANNPLYVAASLAVVAGDDCRDSYTLTQLADGFSTDGCLSTEPGVFSDFGGYDNATWEVVEPAVTAFDVNRRFGIEISAVIPEKYFSDCAMELNDYWENEPIRLEVSWIHDSYTGFSDDCKMVFPSAKRTQVGQVANQSGEWLLREYIKGGVYENFAGDFDSPRLREILNSQRRSQVDRKSFYRVYYLQANVYRKAYNFGQHPETMEAMIAFKEGDPKAAEFELVFGSVLSKFDIALTKR